MADIEIEGDIRLPASLSGSAGVKVTRNGVDYLVTLTPEDLAEIISPTTAGRWVIVWNETDQVSERVALSTLALDPGLVADIDTAVGLAADVDAVELVASAAGRRNRIVNPDCSISQQGPVTAATAFFYGGADQWFVVMDGTPGTATLTAASGAAGTNAPISGTMQGALVTRTGGTFISHVQRIEAPNTRDLVNQRVTIVAKVWQDTGAAINGYISLATPTATDNFATTTALVSQTPVSISTSTWTTLTFTTASVLGVEVAKGLQVAVNFAVGSVTAKNFNVGEVGLYAGTSAPPFEPLSRDEEVSRCLRYYYVGGFWMAGYGTTGGGLRQSLTLPTTMRANPTVTFNNTTYTNGSGIGTYSAAPYAVAFSYIVTATGMASVDTTFTLNARL